MINKITNSGEHLPALWLTTHNVLGEDEEAIVTSLKKHTITDMLTTKCGLRGSMWY